MISALRKSIAQLEAPPPWGFLSAVNTAIIPIMGIMLATLLTLSALYDRSYAPLAAALLGSVVSVAYVFASRRHPADRAALRLEPGNMHWLLTLLLGVGFGIVVDLISITASGSFLPAQELQPIYFSSVPLDVLGWIVVVLFMLLAKPIAEELVFRGVFFPAARQYLGAWPGFIVTALAYTMYHYVIFASANSDIWYALSVPLLISLILNTFRAYTGSTQAVILAHMGITGFALVKLLVMM
jgi:membrane protease YdiL (CAAX protease family)